MGQGKFKIRAFRSGRIRTLLNASETYDWGVGPRFATPRYMVLESYY